jgi:sterol desaturase/sphingolipid hydroxylase (fatty acid hydroxylase superfamily)
VIAPALVGGAFLALVLLERRFPLRTRRERTARRLTRNLAVAAVGALALRLLEQPVIVPLSRLVAARGWGLVPRLPLPDWARRLTAILLLDYTLYIWHVLTHRVPFLWRFHRIHHADPDLDASTAVRFHFGELALSVPWRAAQVLLIGTDPRTLRLWQVGLLVSILFHHANVRLPEPIDRLLSLVLVTPRLHGIHHSGTGHHRRAHRPRRGGDRQGRGGRCVRAAAPGAGRRAR